MEKIYFDHWWAIENNQYIMYDIILNSCHFNQQIICLKKEEYIWNFGMCRYVEKLLTRIHNYLRIIIYSESLASDEFLDWELSFYVGFISSLRQLNTLSIRSQKIFDVI